MKNNYLLILIIAGLFGFAGSSGNEIEMINRKQLDSFSDESNVCRIYVVEYQGKKFMVNSRGGVCQIQ